MKCPIYCKYGSETTEMCFSEIFFPYNYQGDHLTENLKKKSKIVLLYKKLPYILESGCATYYSLDVNVESVSVMTRRGGKYSGVVNDR